MSSTKRALLYLVRKRSKSILLFVILLTLMTLVITVVSIGNAADQAAAELRRTLGGYFKLENDPEYLGQREAITDSLIDQINIIDGVKTSNKMNLEYLIAPSLTLEAGRFTAEGDEKAHLARFLGNSDSSLNEYFLLRTISLIEGRHIAPNDQGKAVISKELANLNGLSVGDTISAEIYLDDMDNESRDGLNSYDWEIVGIFDVNTESENGGIAAECDKVNNFIFSDIFSMMNVQTDMNAQNAGKYRQASFFVDDPEQLNTIIDKVYETESVNWDSFKININDKAYQNAVSPLNRLTSYTNLFLFVVILISIILLSLILTMWMRERLWEIGVLLSIGIKKISLIWQHILEVSILLLLALAAAFPLSNVVAGFVGNTFLESAKTIMVSVGLKEFLFVILYGVCISLISVGLSSILIMRLKPKDILSSMV